jgi:hypothetical protein
VIDRDGVIDSVDADPDTRDAPSRGQRSLSTAGRGMNTPERVGQWRAAGSSTIAALGSIAGEIAPAGLALDDVVRRSHTSRKKGGLAEILRMAPRPKYHGVEEVRARLSARGA